MHVIATLSVRPENFYRIISQHPLAEIYGNFVESISTKRSCAYWQQVPVQWFFTKVFHFQAFLIVNFHRNFTVFCTTKRVFAYLQYVPVLWVLAEQCPIDALSAWFMFELYIFKNGLEYIASVNGSVALKRECI